MTTTPGTTNPADHAAQVTVSIKPMRLSDDRHDYFVAFECGGRSGTPHVFRERFKAEYHVAFYRWLFEGGDEPDLMAFDEDEWPARTFTPDEQAAFAALSAPVIDGKKASALAEQLTKYADDLDEAKLWGGPTINPPNPLTQQMAREIGAMLKARVPKENPGSHPIDPDQLAMAELMDVPEQALQRINGRDLWECANQLAGYVDERTPKPLGEFLMREGRAANDLAYEVLRLRVELAVLKRRSGEMTYQTGDPESGD